MQPETHSAASVTQASEALSRFRIEKLEDRIAPAKGGIPGSPNSGYGWGYEHFCYSHPHHPKCAWLWG
jgi:hypothetical protein